MKVILMQDVKGVGKKGNVVDVADGYGNNFLIAKKLAVLQTKSTLNDLSKEKEDAKKLDEKNKDEALKLKEKLSTIEVLFVCKAGKEGKIHNSISLKQVADGLLKQHKIVIDKRNFKSHNPINCLGYSILNIVLYKDIIGTIKVRIEEAK